MELLLRYSLLALEYSSSSIFPFQRMYEVSTGESSIVHVLPILDVVADSHHLGVEISGLNLVVMNGILHSDEEYICFLQDSIALIEEFHLVNQNRDAMSEIPSWVEMLVIHILFSELRKHPQGGELGILSWDVLFFRMIFLSAVGEYRSMEVFSHHENVRQILLGVRVLMGTCCCLGENLRIHHACLEREFLEDYDPGEEKGDLR